MSAADRERWDARHRLAATQLELRAAPPDVLRGVDVPERGRALDVACGRGGAAVWLALRGLAVDAVDVSAVALAAGAALAAAEGVAVRWWAHDLDAGLPAGCTGPYDVVVCQRFRDATRYPVLAELLAPGGLLAITVLSEVDDEPGPYRAAPGELLAAFGHLEVLGHGEGTGEAWLVARAR